jgi:hypothetical protein
MELASAKMTSAPIEIVRFGLIGAIFRFKARRDRQDRRASKGRDAKAKNQEPEDLALVIGLASCNNLIRPWFFGFMVLPGCKLAGKKGIRNGSMKVMRTSQN